MAAGLVTILTLLSLVLELPGKLRSDGPPIAAVITPAEVYEPEVRWSVYHAEHPELTPGPQVDADEIGIVFRVDLRIQGLKSKTTALHWRALDGGGVEIETPAWVPRTLEVVPDQDDSHFTLAVWSPQPPVVEAFALQFSFEDHDHVTRATANGPTVRFGRF